MEQSTHSGTGSLIIDRDAREVTVDGLPIHLTNAEFTLLVTLADSPRRAFSSEHLTMVLTDSEWFSEAHTLQVTVSRLRRKLGESGTQPRHVFTVHGYGYRFEPGNGADLAAAMASNAQPAPLDPLTLRAFALVALDRSILWASDTFTPLLGWQPRDLQGAILYELMHPDDRHRAMAARDDLNAGYPSAFFIHFRNAAGEYRLFEALARPIVDAHGATTCFLGEYRPATTAQTTELALPDPIHVGHPE